jgi:hypothetical protein
MIDNSKIKLITVIIISSVVLILFLGIIFAARPATLLKEAKASTRTSHMITILGAVYMYSIDNRGAFPPCILVEGAVDITECTELIPYLYQGRFPIDPEPKAKYMIEYIPGTENKIRIFSTAPEAKGAEIIR